MGFRFLFILIFFVSRDQWLEDIQSNFSNVKFAGKHFFKLINSGKKQTVRAKNVRKKLVVTLAIFDRRRLKQK